MLQFVYILTLQSLRKSYMLNLGLVVLSVVGIISLFCLLFKEVYKAMLKCPSFTVSTQKSSSAGCLYQCDWKYRLVLTNHTSIKNRKCFVIFNEPYTRRLILISCRWFCVFNHLLALTSGSLSEGFFSPLTNCRHSQC